MTPLKTTQNTTTQTQHKLEFKECLFKNNPYFIMLLNNRTEQKFNRKNVSVIQILVIMCPQEK